MGLIESILEDIRLRQNNPVSPRPPLREPKLPGPRFDIRPPKPVHPVLPVDPTAPPSGGGGTVGPLPGYYPGSGGFQDLLNSRSGQIANAMTQGSPGILQSIWGRFGKNRMF